MKIYGVFPLQKKLIKNGSENSKDWVWIYHIDGHYFGLTVWFHTHIYCFNNKYYIRFGEPCYDVCFPDFKSACARLMKVTVEWYFNFDRKKQTT